MIDVSEIYIAHQGEGPNLGKRSLFLRLQRCNLRCVWCDSKFTWDPKGGQRTTIDGLVNLMVGFAGSDFPRNLVITGGEPLIWQRELPKVIQGYRQALGYPITTEIETAGTITPSQELLNQPVHFNVSPKLLSAQEGRAPPLWNREALKEFMRSSYNFKIVVSNQIEDLLALRFLIDTITGIGAEVGFGWGSIRNYVYLMPEGTESAKIAKEMRRIIDLADAFGVNVTTRLQILAYGNERGK